MDAFLSYDFDGDARWAAHLAGVEVAGDAVAGDGESRAMRLVKAKWYKRVVDPSFDVDAVRRGGPSRAQPAATKPAAPPPRPARPSPTPPPPPTGGRSGGPPDPPPIAAALFGLHCTLVLLAAVSLLPVPSLGRRAYVWALQLAIGLHGRNAWRAVGTPSLRPFPSALADFGRRLATCTDAHYVALALAFMPGRPVVGVLVPMACLATYNASAYANQRFGAHPLWQRYGVRAHRWLADRQQQALMFNAVSEISLGFLTMVALLSPGRSFSQLYVTWSVLRQRYRCPDASWYHRTVWQLIDEKAAPFYSRVGLLAAAIARARAWFTA